MKSLNAKAYEINNNGVTEPNEHGNEEEQIQLIKRWLFLAHPHHDLLVK